jgi:thiamine-monophosphate kinase
MTLKELGEFGLIERIKKNIKTDASVVKGSGDDCAVMKFDRDRYLLSSCDMIVQGVDFSSKDKPYFVGRKALAVSLSDIAACGGIPRYAMVSVGLPKNTPLDKIDQIIKGITDLAGEFKVNIVGGDISRSQELVIDVSIIGIVEKKFLVLRKGAKKGDIIFVTGSLGGSIAAKHLRFIPRVAEARNLVKKFKIHSMIDISDGLVQDLGHILKESQVGAVIYEDMIPLDRAARGIEDALYCGEDFELLFTLPRKEAIRLYRDKAFFCKPIGEVFAQDYGLKFIDGQGRVKDLKPKGFRHF